MHAEVEEGEAAGAIFEGQTRRWASRAARVERRARRVERLTHAASRVKRLMRPRGLFGCVAMRELSHARRVRLVRGEGRGVSD